VVGAEENTGLISFDGTKFEKKTQYVNSVGVGVGAKPGGPIGDPMALEKNSVPGRHA